MITKKKKIFDLNKKTVSDLTKNAVMVKGGSRSIFRPTTFPTVLTMCFDCG